MTEPEFDPHAPECRSPERPEVTERRPAEPNWNRITVFEVVGYTLAIVFIGVLAMGVFDIMLPWST